MLSLVPLRAQAEESKQQGWEQVCDFVIGEVAADTIYLGMWSYHFFDSDEEYRTTHNLFAVTYNGFYAGTFENSSDYRVWGVGIQRDVYRTNIDFVSLAIGYRLGILYGFETIELYDTGLLPLFQVYGDLYYKNVGLQFSWAGSVVTAGFLIRF